MTAFDRAWSLVKRGLLDSIHGQRVVPEALASAGLENGLRPMRRRATDSPFVEHQRFSRTRRGRSPDHIKRVSGGTSLANTKGRVSDIGKPRKSVAEVSADAKMRMAGERSSR